MISEMQKYKCPSCGHQLGEIEFKKVCENNQRHLEQLAGKRLNEQKIQHTIQMQQLQEKHELENEKEVKIRVEKQFNDEKERIEQRHKQDLTERDKMMELVRHRAAEQTTENIKQAVNQNEAQHLQIEKEYQLKLKRLESQLEKQQKIIDSTAPELRGTAGEFVLRDLLQNEFRSDNFTSKKTGISMSDIIQTIVTETGETIPTPIVYDVKKGDNVTKSDIAKAKYYMSVHNTHHSIIVTKDIKNEPIDGDSKILCY